jgi:hypothetical protein
LRKPTSNRRCGDLLDASVTVDPFERGEGLADFRFADRPLGFVARFRGRRGWWPTDTRFAFEYGKGTSKSPFTFPEPSEDPFYDRQRLLFVPQLLLQIVDEGAYVPFVFVGNDLPVATFPGWGLPVDVGGCHFCLSPFGWVS